MIYLLSFIIVIGLPVFLHELGHFLAARSVGIKVEKFYVGFNLFGLGLKKKYKDTEYGIGLFPMGGYVKVAGILDESLDMNSEKKDYEFRSKNMFQKIWFLSAGVLMNFLLSTVIFSFFIFYDGIPEVVDLPIISEVTSELRISDKLIESPASSIGLMKGDEIIAINNLNVFTWKELSDVIHNNPDTIMNIKWSRNNDILSSSILPMRVQHFINGEIKDIGIVGISPNFTMRDASILRSIITGFEQTLSVLSQISSSLKALFNGSVSMGDFFGPIGLVKMAGETAETGIKPLFFLTAMISVNLGLINILPIPGLDGGHVFIALIEGIIRRDLPLKIKYGIQFIGFILIMSLFIFVLFNDISRLIVG
jgi:regulator of sigma E protease